MAATKCIVICHSDFTQHTMVATFWKTVLESRSAKLSCHALRLSEGTMVLCDPSFTQHTMMASYHDIVLLSLSSLDSPGIQVCQTVISCIEVVWRNHHVMWIKIHSTYYDGKLSWQCLVVILTDSPGNQVCQSTISWNEVAWGNQ